MIERSKWSACKISTNQRNQINDPLASGSIKSHIDLAIDNALVGWGPGGRASKTLQLPGVMVPQAPRDLNP